MGYKNYNSDMNSYMKQRYNNRRNAWIEKLGGCCIECGTTDKLEFDHIDPATKEYSIAKILASGSEIKLYAEMLKCQLLCHEHHLEKTKRNKEYRK